MKAKPLSEPGVWKHVQPVPPARMQPPISKHPPAAREPWGLNQSSCAPSPLAALCQTPRGSHRSTCFEPAIGREGICCFSGSVPVLTEDGGSLHEQFPFLALETRCHLGQAHSEWILGSSCIASTACPPAPRLAEQLGAGQAGPVLCTLPAFTNLQHSLPTCRTSFLRWKGSPKCLQYSKALKIYICVI